MGRKAIAIWACALTTLLLVPSSQLMIIAIRKSGLSLGKDWFFLSLPIIPPLLCIALSVKLWRMKSVRTTRSGMFAGAFTASFLYMIIMGIAMAFSGGLTTPYLAFIPPAVLGLPMLIIGSLVGAGIGGLLERRAIWDGIDDDDDDEDDEEEEEEPDPPTQHSGIGKISIVLGIFPWGMLILVIALIHLLTEEYSLALQGLFVASIPLPVVIGLITGLIGCFQKDRRKLFAVIGLNLGLVNILTIAGFSLMLWLALHALG